MGRIEATVRCQLEDELKQLHSERERQLEDEFEEWVPPTATGTGR
jgi:hypothetical protein